jgi:hypothetical protein
MTQPQFSPDGAADAARDAAALIRAMLQDDQLAAATVAAHMTWPHLTAMVLARWYADLISQSGGGEDDITAWQRCDTTWFDLT